MQNKPKQYDNDRAPQERHNGPLQRSFAKPTADSHLPWQDPSQNKDKNSIPNTQFAGTHAGKGPKNYIRSDDRIYEDINEALMYHPGIDASEIEASVKDAVVMLSGTVDSRKMKRLVEECAEEISGVQDIKNELRIDTTYASRANASESRSNSGSQH